MEIHKYAPIAQNLGFEILFCDYFGGFDFWQGIGAKIPKDPILRKLYKGIETLSNSKTLKEDNFAWSCMGGIVAKKNSL